MQDQRLQYTLTLATRTSGTGARDTARALDEVRDSAQGASRVVGTEMGPAVEGVQNRYVGAAAAANTYTAGTTKAAGSSRNGAAALLMFSQGLEDAQYGIRGVLNNIPSLVMALGGGMGVAGAVSIAAVAISSLTRFLGDGSSAASEFGEKMTESLDAVISKVGSLNTERIAETNRLINQATEDAITLSKRYDETAQAENKASVAALSNAEKLLTAQDAVAGALGRQVDAYATIEAAAALQAARREEEAKQEAAKENERLLAAANQAWITTQRQGDRERALITAQQELEVARAHLETMREEERTLQRMGGPDATKAMRGAVRGLLAEPGRDNAMRAQEALVKSQEEAVRKAQQLVDEGAAGFEAAMKMVTDMTSAVARNMQTIQVSYAAEDLVARSEDAVAKQRQLVDGLEQAIAQVEPTTAAAQAAKERIQTVLADARVTVEEMPVLVQNLTALMGSIQTGTAAVNGNMETVKTIMASFSSRQQAMTAELQRIAREQDRLRATMTSPQPSR